MKQSLETDLFEFLDPTREKKKLTESALNQKVYKKKDAKDKKATNTIAMNQYYTGEFGANPQPTEEDKD